SENTIQPEIQNNSSTVGNDGSENESDNGSQYYVQNSFGAENFGIGKSNQNSNQTEMYAQNGLNGNFSENSNSDGKSLLQVLTGNYSMTPAKTMVWNPKFDLISN